LIFLIAAPTPRGVVAVSSSFAAGNVVSFRRNSAAILAMSFHAVAALRPAPARKRAKSGHNGLHNGLF